MNNIKLNKMSFCISKVAVFTLIAIYASQVFAVDFNTDILDSEDKKNIDFSRFSQAGYIMPGDYELQVIVNGQSISPVSSLISVKELNKTPVNKRISQICLTKDIIDKVGFTINSFKKITFANDECADFSELPGTEINPEISEGLLKINVPQSYLEYSDATWLPPSRWDNGIPGILVDYNINASLTKMSQGGQAQHVNYNGTTGFNIDAWRFRSDYQGNINHTTGDDSGTDNDFLWSRVYAYRAIPQLKSKLTIGENYNNSDIFNSWRYTGFSLESDDRMLPPKLRGYAPQISGIATTNARVIVSQQGRTIYDSTVPAGPFTIQDLDSSVRGRLDVEILEQNGEKKYFQVDTAYVPYLTRPGQIRYKLIGGRSRKWGHETEGPAFVGSEMSWGIDNRWSLYGGNIFAGDYNSIALGLGRDLLDFGSISLDVSQSFAKFGDNDTKNGKSWRLSYSKRFDDANADISFAGYKFSEKNYMTMQQYLDNRYRNVNSDREKELYTITLNKHFMDLLTSISLQYSYQTYWGKTSSNYYTLSINRYFNAFGFDNISAGLTASRSKLFDKNNDSIFLRLSIPWGTGTTNYSGSMSNNRFNQTLGYSDVLNNGLDSYSINAGVNHGDINNNQTQISAYYNHASPLANISANMSAMNNSYTSFGLSASGGATLTTEGAALHAGGLNGGTRILVGTDGVGGVPIDGGRVVTNPWGIGVITDVSSYYRNVLSVDLNSLPENMEATKSVVESTLTDGAIGYRNFEILQGERIFAILRLSDGTYPPFGASVINKKGRELGMVSDNGLVWLSGLKMGEPLMVKWDGKVKCNVKIPMKLNKSESILLPCTL